MAKYSSGGSFGFPQNAGSKMSAFGKDPVADSQLVRARREQRDYESAQQLRDFDSTINSALSTISKTNQQIEYRKRKKSDDAEYERLKAAVEASGGTLPKRVGDNTPQPRPGADTSQDTSGAEYLDPDTSEPTPVPLTDIQKAYNTWYAEQMAVEQAGLDEKYDAWYAEEEIKLNAIVKANFDVWSAEVLKNNGWYSEDTFNMWYATQQGELDKILSEDYAVWYAKEGGAVDKRIQAQTDAWQAEYLKNMPDQYSYVNSAGELVTGTYSDVANAIYKDTGVKQSGDPHANDAAIADAKYVIERDGEEILFDSLAAADAYIAKVSREEQAAQDEFNKFIYTPTGKIIPLESIKPVRTLEGTGKYGEAPGKDGVTWVPTGKRIASPSQYTIERTGRYAPKKPTGGYQTTSESSFDNFNNLNNLTPEGRKKVPFKLASDEYVDTSTGEVCRRVATTFGTNTTVNIGADEKVVDGQIYKKVVTPGYKYNPGPGFVMDPSTLEIMKEDIFTGSAALMLGPDQYYDEKSGAVYDKRSRYYTEPGYYGQTYQVIPDDYVDDKGVYHKVTSSTILVPVRDDGTPVNPGTSYTTGPDMPDGVHGPPNKNIVATSPYADPYTGIIYYKPIGEEKKFDYNEHSTEDLLMYADSLHLTDPFPDFFYMGVDGLPHVKGRPDEADMSALDDFVNFNGRAYNSSGMRNLTSWSGDFLDPRAQENNHPTYGPNDIVPAAHDQYATRAEYYNAKERREHDEAVAYEKATRYMADPDDEFNSSLDLVLNWGADYVPGKGFWSEVYGRATHGVAEHVWNPSFGELTGYHFDYRADGSMTFRKGDSNRLSAFSGTLQNFAEVLDITSIPGKMLVGPLVNKDERSELHSFGDYVLAVGEKHLAVTGTTYGKEGIRSNIPYDTGNKLIDFALEVSLDADNVVSFAASKSAKIGAKATVIKHADDALIAGIKGLDDDLANVLGVKAMQMAGHGIDDVIAVGSNPQAIRNAFEETFKHMDDAARPISKAELAAANSDQLIDLFKASSGKSWYDDLLRNTEIDPRKYIATLDPTLLRAAAMSTDDIKFVTDINDRVVRNATHTLHKGLKHDLKHGQLDLVKNMENFDAPAITHLARANESVYAQVAAAQYGVMKDAIGNEVINKSILGAAKLYNFSEGVQRAVLYTGMATTPLIFPLAAVKFMKVANIHPMERILATKNLNRMARSVNETFSIFKESASREVVEAMANSKNGAMPLVMMHMLKDLVAGDYVVFGNKILKEAVLEDNMARVVANGQRILPLLKLQKYAGNTDDYNKLKAHYIAQNGYETETQFIDALEDLAKKYTKTHKEVPMEFRLLINEITDVLESGPPAKQISDTVVTTVEDVKYARDYLLNNGDVQGAADLDRVARGISASLDQASPDEIKVLTEYKAMVDLQQAARAELAAAKDNYAALSVDPDRLAEITDAETRVAKAELDLDNAIKESDVISNRIAKVTQELGTDPFDYDISRAQRADVTARKYETSKQYDGLVKERDKLLKEIHDIKNADYLNSLDERVRGTARKRLIELDAQLNENVSKLSDNARAYYDWQNSPATKRPGTGTMKPSKGTDRRSRGKKDQYISANDKYRGMSDEAYAMTHASSFGTVDNIPNMQASKSLDAAEKSHEVLTKYHAELIKQRDEIAFLTKHNLQGAGDELPAISKLDTQITALRNRIRNLKRQKKSGSVVARANIDARNTELDGLIAERTKLQKRYKESSGKYIGTADSVPSNIDSILEALEGDIRKSQKSIDNLTKIAEDAPVDDYDTVVAKKLELQSAKAKLQAERDYIGTIKDNNIYSLVDIKAMRRSFREYAQDDTDKVARAKVITAKSKIKARIHTYESAKDAYKKAVKDTDIVRLNTDIKALEKQRTALVRRLELQKESAANGMKYADSYRPALIAQDIALEARLKVLKDAKTKAMAKLTPLKKTVKEAKAFAYAESVSAQARLTQHMAAIDSEIINCDTVLPTLNKKMKFDPADVALFDTIKTIRNKRDNIASKYGAATVAPPGKPSPLIARIESTQKQLDAAREEVTKYEKYMRVSQPPNPANRLTTLDNLTSAKARKSSIEAAIKDTQDNSQAAARYVDNVLHKNYIKDSDEFKRICYQQSLIKEAKKIGPLETPALMSQEGFKKYKIEIKKKGSLQDDYKFYKQAAGKSPKVDISQLPDKDLFASEVLADFEKYVNSAKGSQIIADVGPGAMMKVNQGVPRAVLDPRTGELYGKPYEQLAELNEIIPILEKNLADMTQDPLGAAFHANVAMEHANLLREVKRFEDRLLNQRKLLFASGGPNASYTPMLNTPINNANRALKEVDAKLLGNQHVQVDIKLQQAELDARLKSYQELRKFSKEFKNLEDMQKHIKDNILTDETLIAKFDSDLEAAKALIGKNRQAQRVATNKLNRLRRQELPEVVDKYMPETSLNRIIDFSKGVKDESGLIELQKLLSSDKLVYSPQAAMDAFYEIDIPQVMGQIDETIDILRRAGEVAEAEIIAKDVKEFMVEYSKLRDRVGVLDNYMSQDQAQLDSLNKALTDMLKKRPKDNDPAVNALTERIMTLEKELISNGRDRNKAIRALSENYVYGIGRVQQAVKQSDIKLARISGKSQFHDISLSDRFKQMYSDHKVIYTHGNLYDVEVMPVGGGDVKIHQLQWSNVYQTEFWIKETGVLKNSEELLLAMEELQMNSAYAGRYLGSSMSFVQQTSDYSTLIKNLTDAPNLHPEFFDSVGTFDDITDIYRRCVVSPLHDYYDKNIIDVLDGAVIRDVASRLDKFGTNSMGACFLNKQGVDWVNQQITAYTRQAAIVQLGGSLLDVKFTPSFGQMQGQFRRLLLEESILYPGAIVDDSIIRSFSEALDTTSALIRKQQGECNAYYLVEANDMYLNGATGKWEKLPTSYRNPNSEVAHLSDGMYSTKTVADSDAFKDWFDYDDINSDDFFLLEELTTVGNKMQKVAASIADAGDNTEYLIKNVPLYLEVQDIIRDTYITLNKDTGEVERVLLPDYLLHMKRALPNPVDGKFTREDAIKQYVIAQAMYQHVRSTASQNPRLFDSVNEQLFAQVRKKDIYKTDSYDYVNQFRSAADVSIKPTVAVEHSVSKGGAAHTLNRTNTLYTSFYNYGEAAAPAIRETYDRSVRQLLDLPAPEKISIALSDLETMLQHDKEPIVRAFIDRVEVLQKANPDMTIDAIKRSILQKDTKMLDDLLTYDSTLINVTPIYDSETEQFLQSLSNPGTVDGSRPMKEFSNDTINKQIEDGRYLDTMPNTRAAHRIKNFINEYNMAQHDMEQSNLVIATLDKTPDQLYSHLATETPGFVVFNTMLGEHSPKVDQSLVKFMSNAVEYDNAGIGIYRFDAANGVQQHVLFLKKEAIDTKGILDAMNKKTYGEYVLPSYLATDATDLEKAAWEQYTVMHSRLHTAVRGDLHSSSLFNMEAAERVYQGLPYDVRVQMVSPLDFQKAGFFKQQHYDVTNLGGYEYRKQLDRFLSNDVHRNSSATAIKVNDRLDAGTAFLNTYVNQDSPLNLNNLYVVGKHLEEDVVTDFKNSHLVGVYAINKFDKAVGMDRTFAEILHITDAKSLALARQLNPVIMGTQEAFRVLQDANVSLAPSNMGVELLRTISSTIKAGYLSTPGWVMRNVISSISKSMFASDLDPGELPMRLGFMARSFQEMHQYNKFMREISTNPDYAQLVKKLNNGDPVSGALNSKSLKYLLSSPEYSDFDNIFQSIYHFAHNSSSSVTKAESLGLEKNGYEQANTVRDSFRNLSDRAKKAYKLPDDASKATVAYYSSLLGAKDLAWKNIHTRSFADGNSNIEAYLRYDTYRWERYRGASYHAADDMVTYAHFDYGNSGKAVQSIEMIVPFLSFKATNTLFWFDMMTTNPHIAAYYADYLNVTGGNQLSRESVMFDQARSESLMSGGLPMGNRGKILKTNFDIIDAMKFSLFPFHEIAESTLGYKTIKHIQEYKAKLAEIDEAYVKDMAIAALMPVESEREKLEAKLSNSYGTEKLFWVNRIRSEKISAIPFIGSHMQRIASVNKNLKGIDLGDSLNAADNSLFELLTDGVGGTFLELYSAVTPSIVGNHPEKYYYGYGNKGYTTYDKDKYEKLINDPTSGAEAGWAGVYRPVADPVAYYTYIKPATDYSDEVEVWTKDPEVVKFAFEHGSRPQNQQSKDLFEASGIALKDDTYAYYYPETDYAREKREEKGEKRKTYRTTNSNNLIDALKHGALPENEHTTMFVSDNNIVMSDEEREFKPVFKLKFEDSDYDEMETTDIAKAMELYAKGATPLNDNAKGLSEYYDRENSTKGYGFNYGEGTETYYTFDTVALIEHLTHGAKPVGSESEGVIAKYGVKVVDAPLLPKEGEDFYSWTYEGSDIVRASYDFEKLIKEMQYGAIPVSDDAKHLQKTHQLVTQHLQRPGTAVYEYRFYGSDVIYRKYKAADAIDIMSHGGIPVSENMKDLQAANNIKLQNIPRAPKEGEKMYAFHYDGSDVTRYVYTEQEAVEIMSHGAIPENDEMIEVYVRRRIILQNLPLEAKPGQAYYAYKYEGSDQIRATYNKDVAISLMSHGGIPVSDDMKQLQKDNKIVLQNYEKPDFTYYKYRYQTVDGYSEVRYTTDKAKAIEMVNHGAIPFNESYKKLVQNEGLTLGNNPDPKRPGYEYTYEGSKKTYVMYSQASMIDAFSHGARPVNQASRDLVKDYDVTLQNIAKKGVRTYSYYYPGKSDSPRETTNLASAMMAMNKGAMPINDDMRNLVDTYDEMAKQQGFAPRKETEKYYKKISQAQKMPKHSITPVTFSKSAAAAQKAMARPPKNKSSSYTPRATKTYAQTPHKVSSQKSFLTNITNRATSQTPHFYVKKSAKGSSTGNQFRSARSARPVDPRVKYLAQAGMPAPKKGM